MNVLYMQTGKIAQLLGIDTKFLNQNKESIFYEGKHFFIPNGKKYCLWKVNEMIAWVENTTNSSEADEVLQKILNS